MMLAAFVFAMLAPVSDGGILVIITLSMLGAWAWEIKKGATPA